MADTTMVCATKVRYPMTHSSKGINLTALMQLMEGGVVAKEVAINKDLGKHPEPTASLTGFEGAVGVDSDDAMGNRLPLEKLARSMAPGTTLENSQLDPLIAGWLALSW